MTRSRRTVAVLDYGSGNLRSVVRALERVGADVTLTSQRETALAADGLVVPGVGAFAACMDGLRAVDGARIVDQRLAGERPVLGVCVGMQVLFERGIEHGVGSDGFGQWPGVVERLRSEVVPHMGWNTVEPAPDSQLFEGLEAARFYFVHSYAVRDWRHRPSERLRAPALSWTSHGSDRFVSAVENGPLWATQFHPEKSGDAGSALLAGWLRIL